MLLTYLFWQINIPCNIEQVYRYLLKYEVNLYAYHLIFYACFIWSYMHLIRLNKRQQNVVLSLKRNTCVLYDILFS